MTVADAVTPQFQIARIFKRMFGAIVDNIGTFALLSLMPGLAAAALKWGQNRIKPPALFMSPPGYEIFALIIGALTIYLLSWFLLQAAVAHGVIASLGGKRGTVGACLTTGLKRFLPLLLIGLISMVAILAAALLLVVPGIIVAVMWLVAAPVCVVEHASVGESFSRSRELTKGYRWPIFGACLLYFIPVFFLLIAIDILVGGDMFPMSEADVLSAEGLVLATRMAGEAIGTMITWTVLSTLIASIYYELRQIKEGIGPEALASVFD